MYFYEKVTEVQSQIVGAYSLDSFRAYVGPWSFTFSKPMEVHGDNDSNEVLEDPKALLNCQRKTNFNSFSVNAFC